MMNKAPAGPRLTKRARERKRQEDKAAKALGGAQLVEVEGDNQKKAPHWHVELQWFRLLRGQARLNQIARILVELAPLKVFNPQDIYAAHLKEQKALEEVHGGENAQETKKGKSKKSGKGKKGMSKKDQIIAANKVKMEKEAAARDAEKLKSLGKSKEGSIKLTTESGKFLYLMQILKQAVKDKHIVDILDTLWEIEQVSKEVDPDEVKSVFKKEASTLKKALEAREDKSMLGKKNLIDFQLTEMSDRLPPLNLHSLSGKFKLDDWQLRVINLINDKKSVLITAPTSSGKTVLSTYVCTGERKTLFVVPTEPLAWQVAAMLRALKLEISLVVPTLTFVPPSFDVVVGTPHALESTLTKQVGFEFDYAIFDEVHSLNNFDGSALQRLIRAMPSTCRYLALSATIGNSRDLQRWFETIVGKGGIELVEHKARFINLQRHVWTSAKNDNQDNTNAEDGVLHQLHPCVSLSTEYLASSDYQKSDLAMTPVDSYNLFKALDTICDGETNAVKTSKLKPKKFFDDEPTKRITLDGANDYADKLKDTLVDLAKTNKLLSDKVLASLGPGAKAKAIKTLTTQPEIDIEVKKVNDIISASADSTSAASLAELFFHLKSHEMIPAICFQLDSVRCQSMFDGLLRELEEQEAKEQPDYRNNLLEKQKQQIKARERLAKQNRKEDDDAVAEDQDFGEGAGALAVDVDAPHPNYSLSPPGRGLGGTEARDTQESLKHDLPSSNEESHPLIRGLRRGIGLYISGLPSAYHRLVQSLAQQGRLGVVFSDELLAYGVNMPFRAAVFFGDTGADWLTPLLHQQMAGRAGRRGLDRQGHLIYAGFTPDRLKTLLRGTLPDVTGRFPLYPTVPLQLEMNKRYESGGKPLDLARMKQICATPLAQFLKGETIQDYYSVAEKWVDALGILDHPESTYSYLVPELVWELRKFLPESLALEYLLEPMIERFRNVIVQQSDTDVQHQTEVYLIFCRVCGRKEYAEIEGLGEEGLGEHDELEASTKFVGILPFPHHKDDKWDYWSTLLKESQDRIINSNLEFKEHMLLPVPMDEPLDNLCYASFIRNQIDPTLPTRVQHDIRERIWNIGEVLRICSNVLGRASELAPLQNLIRKAFIRIRYILDETAQRNWKKLEEVSVDYEHHHDVDGHNPPTPPS